MGATYGNRVLTDATFGYVPQSVGTVGGECEAGVCLSDESRIGEDFEDRSDEEEYSTFGDPPTVDTVGGEFEAVVDEAVEASSDDDDDEDSSDDEADSSYVEEDTVGCEGAALSMALLGEEAMVLDDKKSKGGGCCTDSSRRLKTDISVIGNSPSGIKKSTSSGTNATSSSPGGGFWIPTAPASTTRRSTSIFTRSDTLRWTCLG